MGQKLNTSTLENTPVVSVGKGSKPGQYFIGELKGYKQQESPYKNEKGDKVMWDIYEFTLDDTDMTIQRKVGKEYVNVEEINKGALVSVFAPIRLHTALKQVGPGTRVKFVSLGKGKTNSHGGKAYEFEAETL